MTRDELNKVIAIKQQILDLRVAKQENLVAIQKGYYTPDGPQSFPSQCKQLMTDVVVNYYDYEISKLQHQLDAMTFVLSAEELINLTAETSNP